jgi:hypothetical protein
MIGGVGQRTDTAIRFSARVSSIDASTIVRLPSDASAQLPSRGQVAARGSINGQDFRTVVEPDGLRGHWVRIDQHVQRAASLGDGDHVDVVIEVVSEWPEPQVPDDLATALADAPPHIRDTWHDITPMARWEWVRWVNATANRATRQRRVEVSISKMDNGKRRPCCFDLSACTDPAVSKNGKLRDA